MADDGKKKVMVDEIDKEISKYEVKNLKIALEEANDALKGERQQKLIDRKTYEAKIKENQLKDRKVYINKVNEIEKFYNEEFAKLNDEHDIKLKMLEDEYSKNLSKLRLPPLHPSRDQRCQTEFGQLTNRSQKTSPGNLTCSSMQTSAILSADLSVQTESNNEEPGPDSYQVAAIVAMQAQVDQLKKEVAELMFENNRYHLAISNCTYCASDDPDNSDASSFLDASIRASTPLPCLDPASLSSTIPALMSLTFEDKRHAKVVLKEKSKDKTFICRMVKALNKFESKYQIPEHKRKKRLFTRKSKPSSIVPKELATIYNVLAAPELDAVDVPDPFPHVRWNDVRFKPALPVPEPCPVYSCSKDPDFYQERREYRNGSVVPTVTEPEFLRKARDNGRPFGSLPGYKTSLGVVAIPTTPVGGYVYCPDARKWVIFAEAKSPPSTGRGTRRGGATSHARRRGG